ncbi:3-carboxy-cis,cis-muconate cycloisomerase [Marmoricola sp. Leaf446]|uniref:lyase family protein n=1 Tax=Marmoricola sp. Leaf446 TaxID=1736379 RepID=UPI0006FB5BFE|nr:lyase family protein [Marmoricola sp. Leaf446]KQT94711.1 3-carboxy-cis,cis-muconate cycloisomerase [Marmoricola sp. Leaf446]
MADLLWPGDERAGEVFTDSALLHGLVAVEQAWLDVLVDRGIAPPAARRDLTSLVTSADVTLVASRAESSGNPLVPLLTLLRERGGRPVADPGRWLHRGLTSQDVVDTALVLGARTTTRQLLGTLDRQVAALATLAERHRDDLMAGRTLTQHAVPLTFGLKAAQWLRGVLDARDALRGLRFPVQVGGAAGTLAAVAEIAGGPDAALDAAADLARGLGLEASPPWHTVRTPFTAYADALVRTTDALGHVANDVLVLARPEVGELAEPAVAGRGGSSTMPQKANPVLSVLVRRAALAAPALAAQLHLAAAEAVDERPDGGWHTEWATLATLSRRTLVAASQAAEVLEGLHVDTGAMSALVAQRSSALLAERRSMRELTAPPAGSTRPRPEDDFDPAHYLGATASIIDGVLARAREEN